MHMHPTLNDDVWGVIKSFIFIDHLTWIKDRTKKQIKRHQQSTWLFHQYELNEIDRLIEPQIERYVKCPYGQGWDRMGYSEICRMHKENGEDPTLELLSNRRYNGYWVNTKKIDFNRPGLYTLIRAMFFQPQAEFKDVNKFIWFQVHHQLKHQADEMWCDLHNLQSNPLIEDEISAQEDREQEYRLDLENNYHLHFGTPLWWDFGDTLPISPLSMRMMNPSL